MKKWVYTMKKDDLSLKEDSLSAISHILITQYNMSGEQARQMIKDSGIETFFDRNAEMAAHTSYRTWAQRVYERAQECNSFVLAMKEVSPTKVACEEIQTTQQKISSEIRA